MPSDAEILQALLARNKAPDELLKRNAANATITDVDNERKINPGFLKIGTHNPLSFLNPKPLNLDYSFGLPKPYLEDKEPPVAGKENQVTPDTVVPKPSDESHDIDMDDQKAGIENIRLQQEILQNEGMLESIARMEREHSERVSTLQALYVDGSMSRKQYEDALETANLDKKYDGLLFDDNERTKSIGGKLLRGIFDALSLPLYATAALALTAQDRMLGWHSTPTDTKEPIAGTQVPVDRKISRSDSRWVKVPISMLSELGVGIDEIKDAQNKGWVYVPTEYLSETGMHLFLNGRRFVSDLKMYFRQRPTSRDIFQKTGIQLEDKVKLFSYGIPSLIALDKAAKAAGLKPPSERIEQASRDFFRHHETLRKIADFTTDVGFDLILDPGAILSFLSTGGSKIVTRLGQRTLTREGTKAFTEAATGLMKELDATGEIAIHNPEIARSLGKEVIDSTSPDAINDVKLLAGEMVEHLREAGEVSDNVFNETASVLGKERELISTQVTEAAVHEMKNLFYTVPGAQRVSQYLFSPYRRMKGWLFDRYAQVADRQKAVRLSTEFEKAVTKRQEEYGVRINKVLHDSGINNVERRALPHFLERESAGLTSSQIRQVAIAPAGSRVSLTHADGSVTEHIGGGFSEAAGDVAKWFDEFMDEILEAEKAVGIDIRSRQSYVAHLHDSFIEHDANMSPVYLSREGKSDVGDVYNKFAQARTISTIDVANEKYGAFALEDDIFHIAQRRANVTAHVTERVPYEVAMQREFGLSYLTRESEAIRIRRDFDREIANTIRGFETEMKNMGFTPDIEGKGWVDQWNSQLELMQKVHAESVLRRKTVGRVVEKHRSLEDRLLKKIENATNNKERTYLEGLLAKVVERRKSLAHTYMTENASVQKAMKDLEKLEKLIKSKRVAPRAKEIDEILRALKGLDRNSEAYKSIIEKRLAALEPEPGAFSRFTPPELVQMSLRGFSDKYIREAEMVPAGENLLSELFHVSDNMGLTREQLEVIHKGTGTIVTERNLPINLAGVQEALSAPHVPSVASVERTLAYLEGKSRMLLTEEQFARNARHLDKQMSRMDMVPYTPSKQMVDDLIKRGFPNVYEDPARNAALKGTLESYIGRTHYIPRNVKDMMNDLHKFTNVEARINANVLVQTYSMYTSFRKLMLTIPHLSYSMVNKIGNISNILLNNGLSYFFADNLRDAALANMYLATHNTHGIIGLDKLAASAQGSVQRKLLGKKAFSSIHAQMRKAGSHVVETKLGEKIRVDDLVQEFIDLGGTRVFTNVEGRAYTALKPKSEFLRNAFDPYSSWKSSPAASPAVKAWRTVHSAADMAVDAVSSLGDEYDRLAHYILERKGGASASAAMEEVNKVLYDYANLSAFERVVMRNAFLFYTFPRKNIVGMTRLILNNPGRAGIGVKVITNLDDPAVADTDSPEYMDGRLKFNVNSRHGFALRLPLDDMAQIIDDIINLFRPNVHSQLGARLSTGPSLVWNYFVTGKTPFTGAPIRPQDGKPVYISRNVVRGMPQWKWDLFGIQQDKMAPKGQVRYIVTNPLMYFVFVNSSPTSRFDNVVARYNRYLYENQGEFTPEMAKRMSTDILGMSRYKIDPVRNRYFRLKGLEEELAKELYRFGAERGGYFHKIDKKGSEEVRELSE